MFLYEFAEKTAQKPDTVATYVRRNKKIFKNHVERRQKQIWLDEKAVDILLKKYPEVQKKQKKPLNKEKFEEIITKSLKTLYENQEILAKEIDEIRALVEELEESFDHKQAEQQKEDNGLISLEKLYGIRFQMYYKMRILPVIFLFSMMTKAQDKVVLGFLIHGVKLDS